MSWGGGDGYPSLRQDQFVGVMGGNILDVEHLENLVGALAGDGSGGGKVERGGLRIDVTLFFQEHVICLQMIVVLHGRTTFNPHKIGRASCKDTATEPHQHKHMHTHPRR